MTENEFKTRYIKARRTVIERDFAKLNDMQREAVMTTEGPLLILAGAGSGKTTVLINRIANILRYGRGGDCDEIPPEADEMYLEILEAAAKDPSYPGMEEAKHFAAYEPCEPWRVIAITFTNKAAGELKTRLEAMLGQQAQDIWAQTFHSACVRMLRRYADRLGYTKSFNIYDSNDSESVMKHIIRDLELDEKAFPHRMVLGYVSRAKDELISGEDFFDQAQRTGDVRRQRIGQCYLAYEKRLMDSDAMDFDDLICNTVRLLESDDEVRGYYQRLFKYVLIDEYQDTNKLQYRLAAALAGGHGNICVVGDDDQSIYKFRGATIENILSFEEQFKGAKTIRLEQNYRSCGNILDAANAVIRNNTERKGKNLWTNADGGDRIVHYVAKDETDEASFVASRLIEGFSQGVNWRENAVLYRMNALSNKIEFALKRNSIPYRVVGGNRFFDRMEIKDVLAYLSVIQKPQDELRLLRIINNPPRGIGDKTVETAVEVSRQQELSLYETLQRANEFPELQKSGVKLRLFAAMMDELRAAAETMPPDELFDMVLDKTGYIRALEAKDTDENRARIENVGELKSNIITYMNESEEASLAGFMDEVALYTDMDSLSSDSDCVVLMTMHAAKGLEFDNVYIVGVEEGIFPGIRSIGVAEEMEEERRLCYVGITRARKKLYICSAGTRMLFGKTTANKTSRFIEEIPDELLEKRGVFARRDSFSSGRSYEFDDFVQERGTGTKVSEKRPAAVPLAPKPASQKLPEYKTGDSVKHKAFGDGVITKLTPMGGDCLVEIEFSTAGTKRFMLRAAAQFLQKI